MRKLVGFALLILACRRASPDSSDAATAPAAPAKTDRQQKAEAAAHVFFEQPEKYRSVTYCGDTFAPTTGVFKIDWMNSDACVSAESCKVSVVSGDSAMVTLVFTELGGKPEIDLGASDFGVNRLKLKAYQASLPTTPFVYHLWARLSTYYNYEFIHAESTHYAVSLSEQRDSIAQVTGYAPKSAPYAQALFSLLQDDKPHRVAIEIIYMDHPKSNTIVGISAFFHEGDNMTADECAIRRRDFGTEKL